MSNIIEELFYVNLEHNKRDVFMLMVTKCTLWPYLADIDRQANECMTF